MDTGTLSKPGGKAGAALATLVALALLSGCARELEVKRAFGQSNHVSPTPPVVAKLPPGTFDQQRGQSELLKARETRLAGDAAGARRLAEAAVADWPGDATAWEELGADCRGLGDQVCAGYADFFGAKVDFINAQPPRVGVLGFATLAQGQVGTHTGDYVYDQRTLDTAARLASFYDERDALSPLRMPPVQTEPKP
jgi:hypothetical protein